MSRKHHNAGSKEALARLSNEVALLRQRVEQLESGLPVRRTPPVMEYDQVPLIPPRPGFNDPSSPYFGNCRTGPEIDISEETQWAMSQDFPVEGDK